jgi:uncharacterized protein (TIGR02996 family)
MTTEDDFAAALDADPEDHNTRLVFADWLQERGDPRAEGYRALGALRLKPSTSAFNRPDPCWGFSHPENSYANQRSRRACVLPRDWWEVMDPGVVSRASNASWNWHLSRRATEDAAALAFASLPPERRAELLAATPTKKKRKTGTRTKSAAQKPKGKGKK